MCTTGNGEKECTAQKVVVCGCHTAVRCACYCSALRCWVDLCGTIECRESGSGSCGSCTRFVSIADCESAIDVLICRVNSL